MDDRDQNSSTELTADGGLVGVCEDCCTDGSLLSTDCNAASSCTVPRTGADSGDHGARELDDNVCTNFTAIDADDTELSLDIVEPHSDVMHDSFASGHGRSSSNDRTDVSAAEKVTLESGEKQSGEGNADDAETRADVDEPIISATDIYSGLNLFDSWNPVKAQRRREVGVGRVAPSQFSCKASGSLALVRRLQLYSKLDGHTGCVNALHFNDAGKLLIGMLTRLSRLEKISRYRALNFSLSRSAINSWTDDQRWFNDGQYANPSAGSLRVSWESVTRVSSLDGN